MGGRRIVLASETHRFVLTVELLVVKFHFKVGSKWLAGMKE